MLDRVLRVLHWSWCWPSPPPHQQTSQVAQSTLVRTSLLLARPPRNRPHPRSIRCRFLFRGPSGPTVPFCWIPAVDGAGLADAKAEVNHQWLRDNPDSLLPVRDHFLGAEAFDRVQAAHPQMKIGLLLLLAQGCGPTLAKLRTRGARHSRGKV